MMFNIDTSVFLFQVPKIKPVWSVDCNNALLEYCIIGPYATWAIVIF